MANERTVTVVLGGGRGSRLYPLTALRAKPAVPLAGKYRLIDIPISNAINSGMRQIFVLTQFNSASLNSHIAKTYRFDFFSGGFVEVLAAEQTDTSGDWYQGTADAIRQTLHHIDRTGAENVVILSGDHLYRMDYRPMLARHVQTGADITVSNIGVAREECGGFGVMNVDERGRVIGFREKPGPEEDLTALETPGDLRARWGMGDKPFLASMGVYVFRMAALRELLADPQNVDFGHHVLPKAIHSHHVVGYYFDGYWADIGTIRAFYDANIALCHEDPPFRFYRPDAPIYTRARFLPASRFRRTMVERSIVADGCLAYGARIEGSVIGLRARLMGGSEVIDSIVMGAETYEDDPTRARLVAEGRIPIGIGEGASIRYAIIDKDARIGEGAVIHGAPDRPDEETSSYVVRDGIVIVPKNATIPPGTVI